MAHVRRNTTLDIKANRAWTADAVVDLASIDAFHGDVAYVTATSQGYVYVDGAGWINVSAGSGVTGTNTGDVTLAGTPDYITISGQVITRGSIDLATDITGDLPSTDGGTGSSLNPTWGQLLSGVTNIGGGTFELITAGDVNEVLQGGGGAAAPAFTSTPSLEGIVFPATQVASGGANTLDDYEEGTWTPGLSFGGGTTGITYSLQAGSYQKIGLMVFFRCYVVLSAKGSSTGDALVTGLPFTSVNGNPISPVTVGFYNGLASLTFCPIASISTNVTTITLHQGGAASVGNLTDANFTNSSYLSLSGFYPSSGG